MTEKEINDLLLKPFDKDQIQKRKGPGGKFLSYISQGDCTKRLLDAWGNSWSFSIEEHVKTAKNIVLRCRLISPSGRYREQYGSAEIRGDIGDNFKTAASDGLKKCASMFGVGLHLYGVEVE